MLTMSSLSSHQIRHWQSFAIALGMEALLAVVVIGWAFQHLPTTPPEVIPLNIETVVSQTVEIQKTLESKTKPSLQPNPKPAPQTQFNTAQVPQDAPVEPHVAQQPLTKESPLPSVPAVKTPQITSPAVDPALAYNVKLAAAVQAAFEVPGSAKALAFKGKARLEFTLNEGMASAIRVIQSSGLGAVDRAAIKAVESATFPLPPSELKNKVGTYQIWVACF